jgi:hypothetical protein
MSPEERAFTYVVKWQATSAVFLLPTLMRESLAVCEWTAALRSEFTSVGYVLHFIEAAQERLASQPWVWSGGKNGDSPVQA